MSCDTCRISSQEQRAEYSEYPVLAEYSEYTKIWNSIAESTKSLPLSKFKKKNKEKMIEKY